MCGIFGIINKSDSAQIDKCRVKQSANLMLHRGPDAFGQWGIVNKIELAHLRLSIIDLSPESNQPFFSNCKNFVIVFNGEIYNYIEIRQELKSLGHKFRTAGDTEVLLNSYIEWGEKCIEKFNGDWAFSIYDIKNDILFCSRDRFGVKPFNYLITEDQFIFSSEIKSILDYYPHLRQPNHNIISNFCRNSLGAQSEDTWFVGIKRLLPAHNLIWKNGKIEIKKYWEYPLHTDDKMSFGEATETYRELFINAVKLRMRSDVPIGTTLSSGLDSSSIVAVLRKFYGDRHKTFTAVFNLNDYQRLEKNLYRRDIEINEGILVKKIATELNLEAHLINIPNDDFIQNLSHIIYHLESGHSSPATLPLSKLFEYAQNYVTVVMEGQGADELLGGYTTNMLPALLWEYFKRGKFIQLRREFNDYKDIYTLGYLVKLYFRLLNSDPIERVYQLQTGISKVFGSKLKKYKRIKDYPAPPKFNEIFNKGLFKSHTGVLVDLLHYGDAISMSKSIESRLPFMDVNLVEFSFQLPFYNKMYNGLGKYIHRVAMQNIVPKNILENPIKFGFNTPLSKHFASLNEGPNSILLSAQCLDRGIFDKTGLESLMDDHIRKKRDNSTILFRLLSVELWYRRFID